MNSKYYQRLVSSVLMALSLSSSVYINNKIANANYKDDDKENLSSLFTNTNNKDIGSELFDTVKNIRKRRYDNNKSSILYNSIVGNSINNFLNNEENKKHYGPDLCKALLYQLRAVHGGHFTVWNDKIKSKIKELEDKFCNEINCCDAWFWALGGTQKNIDEYKEKLNLKYDNCKNNDNIRCDVPRTWSGIEDTSIEDTNIKEKRKVLDRILKIYDFGKRNYIQGFNFFCMNIIDKFVGCKNTQISDETEAKIYYVYEMIIGKLDGIFNDLFSTERDISQHPIIDENSVDLQKPSLQFIDTFARSHEDLKLPSELDICNKVSQGEIKLNKLNKKQKDEAAEAITYHKSFVTTFVQSFCDGLDRDLRIKLLDEMIYAEDLKNKNGKEIAQKMMDVMYEFVINNYEKIKVYFGEEPFLPFMKVYLRKKQNYNLQFSNDIQN